MKIVYTLRVETPYTPEDWPNAIGAEQAAKQAQEDYLAGEFDAMDIVCWGNCKVTVRAEE